MLTFALLDRRIGLFDAVGVIPTFLSLDDPRPAREQIDERYISGWHPFPGHVFDPETMSLRYEDDPVLMPIAFAKLRDEQIFVYPYGWTLILQPDGSWEIARLD